MYQQSMQSKQLYLSLPPALNVLRLECFYDMYFELKELKWPFEWHLLLIEFGQDLDIVVDINFRNFQ